MEDTLTNPEAEAELLGNLMRDNSQIDYVADLVSPADFAVPVHERLFSAIVREASLGRTANPITLRGYFENDDGMKDLGGIAYLMQLTASAYQLATPEVARQVHDLASRRRMREGLRSAIVVSEDLESTIAEVIDCADSAVTVEGARGIHQPTAAECLDELIASYRGAQPGVLCGSIPALDTLMGPMRPKQLVVGAGRPGMGKTALALSYALGAAGRGHGVMFVSLEMSSTELAARMASALCYDDNHEDGVPFENIRDGRLEDWERHAVAKARDRLREMPLQIIDVGQLTIGRLNMLIRRHARRMSARGKQLELVIIDYLQLLSPDSRNRSSYEAVSEISRGLKAMAKDHGLPIFALAQLSRETEKRVGRRPQLSDLRDSGQIEQDADAVLLLLREEYYLAGEKPDGFSPKYAEWARGMAQVEGQIEFILAKRRNGRTGTSRGQFVGKYQVVR